MVKFINLLLSVSFMMVCCTHAVTVQERLDSMTLEQKIGQMVQIDISKFMIPGTTEVDYTLMKQWIVDYNIGSILNSPFSSPINGVSGWTASEWRQLIVKMQEFAQESETKIPVIYGIDSIHGATYTKDAALFPQALGTAASFDRAHAYNGGKTASKDTRASGIPWLFAPVLGLGLHPLWARFSETFGEDMYLAAEMGVATIKGMQDVVEDGGVPTRAAACMKHFIAYSMPVNGHDRSPVELPDRVLRQWYIPSFKAAVDAGVMTAMESYNEVGGVPMVSSAEYLKKLLRQEMKFTGMMVTDYSEIKNLYNWHKAADSQRNAVKMAMQDTSIDMSMVPLDSSFYDLLLDLVHTGELDESRIDESARRVLQLKEDLGMFADPVPSLDDPNVATVGQDSDWDLALDASRSSITLLQNNDNSLPIPTTSNIFVTGPTSDSLISQSGGWSLHWQGAVDNSEFSRGKTILNGLQDVFTGTVKHLAGPDLLATDLSKVDMVQVLKAVAAADTVVICVGEGGFAEKPGDIDDLALPQGQLDYVTRIRAAAPTKNIVLVIVSQRPRLLHSAVASSSSVINTNVPGPMGGLAVAEIIAGKVVPSGRLPYTYPRHAGDIPYAYHHKPGDMCVTSTGAFINCQAEWEFGHGLSYTTFAYSDLTLSADSISDVGSLDVSVTVKNTGAYDAQHSVLLFLTDMYRRVTPEYKLLKRFDKAFIAQGASRTFSWTLTAKDLEYVGIDSRYVLEAGRYFVGIGNDVDCRSDNPDAWKSVNGGETMCAGFDLTLPANYNPICEYGCNLWGQGLCGASVDAETCYAQCAADAWTWNYVDCLQQYDQASCSVSDIQCYDSFSISTAAPEEDSGDSSGYSTSFVITLLSCTCAVSLLLGALLSFVGYRYVNRRSLNKPLNKPLLNSDQFGAVYSQGYSEESASFIGTSNGLL